MRGDSVRWNGQHYRTCSLLTIRVVIPNTHFTERYPKIPGGRIALNGSDRSGARCKVVKRPKSWEAAEIQPR
jgi:hypothetical protein